LICVSPVEPTVPPAPVIVTGVDTRGKLRFDTMEGRNTNPEQAVSNNKFNENRDDNSFSQYTRIVAYGYSPSSTLNPSPVDVATLTESNVVKYNGATITLSSPLILLFLSCFWFYRSGYQLFLVEYITSQNF
jgi:hypothetical protein